MSAAIGKLALARRARVTLDLPLVDRAMLDALSRHTGKSEAAVIGDALRLLFAALPRPDDAPRPGEHRRPPTVAPRGRSG